MQARARFGVIPPDNKQLLNPRAARHGHAVKITNALCNRLDRLVVSKGRRRMRSVDFQRHVRGHTHAHLCFARISLSRGARLVVLGFPVEIPPEPAKVPKQDRGQHAVLREHVHGTARRRNNFHVELYAYCLSCRRRLHGLVHYVARAVQTARLGVAKPEAIGVQNQTVLAGEKRRRGLWFQKVTGDGASVLPTPFASSQAERAKKTALLRDRGGVVPFALENLHP